MTTLRTIEITDNASTFLDAVRRIKKEEPDLSDGEAINKARQSPSGKRLFNSWSETGRPGTL
jgi:hypothetical protein